MPDQRSRKRDRNLRLLRQAVLDYPEEPYFEYRLGSETLLLLDGEVLPVAGLRASLGHLESAWRKVAANRCESPAGDHNTRAASVSG